MGEPVKVNAFVFHFTLLLMGSIRVIYGVTELLMVWLISYIQIAMLGLAAIITLRKQLSKLTHLIFVLGKNKQSS